MKDVGGGVGALRVQRREDRRATGPRSAAGAHHHREPLTQAGLPVAKLADTPPADVDPDASRRLRAADDGLTPRTRHILTVRRGLAGVPARTLREAGDALDLHLPSVHTTEARAIALLGPRCLMVRAKLGRAP